MHGCFFSIFFTFFHHLSVKLSLLACWSRINLGPLFLRPANIASWRAYSNAAAVFIAFTSEPSSLKGVDGREQSEIACTLTSSTLCRFGCAKQPKSRAPLVRADSQCDSSGDLVEMYACFEARAPVPPNCLEPVRPSVLALFGLVVVSRLSVRSRILRGS